MSEIPHAVWEDAEEKLEHVRRDITATGLPRSVDAALDALDLLIKIYASDE